jgi:hypothetical protein
MRKEERIEILFILSKIKAQVKNSKCRSFIVQAKNRIEISRIKIESSSKCVFIHVLNRILIFGRLTTGEVVLFEFFKYLVPL